MGLSTTNDSIVTRYTDQPARMPAALRRRIEDDWAGRPVQLYAVADLDASMRLVPTWVALGAEHVALVRQDNGAFDGPIVNIERARIREVREIPQLGCTQLVLLGAPDEPALASVRYTHRQRRAMDNLKFVLDQQIEGNAIAVGNADDVYCEAVAHAVREAQASITVNKLGVLWRLLDHLRPYKARVVAGVIGAVLLTAVSLVPPYLTGYLIDDVVRPVQEGERTAQSAVWLAALVVAGIAAVFVLRQLMAWVRMRAMSILGEYVARDLRTRLYEHMQQLSLSFFSSKQTGSLISRISSDTDRLWDFLAWGAVDFLLSMVTLAWLGTMLLLLDWRLGLIMTAPLPILFYAIYRYGFYMHRIFLRCWRKWSDMTAVLSDTIPGVRVVKAFNQEQREKERFDRRNFDATRSFNKVHVTWTTFWPVMWLFLHLMMIGVWVCAVPRVLDMGVTGPYLTVGTFVAFILYMGMYVHPVEMITRMTFIINRATSSAHRVFEILDTEPEVRGTTEPVRLDPVQGRVQFENVSFAYDGVRQILRNMSFEVEPGEMIGLVGPSGAGKSTVTNLVARFYNINSGQILIDGVDICRLDLGHYRRQLGIVMQDPHLFHGSLLENIRYGVPDATLGDVIAAARAANAHDFICKLPHGYDTLVGERGHTLSGGERQRVSIARAVLSNPRILILDEATSSVDTETEHKIQDALERLIEGRTVFAIAHRLSTLRKAKRLLVIEDGQITEQGTHAELLDAAEGTYSKLVRMQQQLHEMYVA
ncbi:MAG TPA: ABC transporter ATP-binding protein [Candidatus Hydrogenedentes bacterium]|nr:ABC transporter ATP-binding protein [Candidatus Hydrogenedentota bacterium]